jgi:hypothetical protein
MALPAKIWPLPLLLIKGEERSQKVDATATVLDVAADVHWFGAVALTEMVFPALRV